MWLGNESRKHIFILNMEPNELEKWIFREEIAQIYRR